jgi:hypothetical protein
MVRGCCRFFKSGQGLSFACCRLWPTNLIHWFWIEEV